MNKKPDPKEPWIPFIGRQQCEIMPVQGTKSPSLSNPKYASKHNLFFQGPLSFWKVDLAANKEQRVSKQAEEEEEGVIQGHTA